MMLSCHEVTHLVSQSQERKLSMVQRMSLQLHLLMCDGCKNFSRQIPFLRTSMTAYSERVNDLIEDASAKAPEKDVDQKP